MTPTIKEILAEIEKFGKGLDRTHERVRAASAIAGVILHNMEVIKTAIERTDPDRKNPLYMEDM